MSLYLGLYTELNISFQLSHWVFGCVYFEMRPNIIDACHLLPIVLVFTTLIGMELENVKMCYQFVVLLSKYSDLCVWVIIIFAFITI